MHIRLENFKAVKWNRILMWTTGLIFVNQKLNEFIIQKESFGQYLSCLASISNKGVVFEKKKIM